MGRSDEALVAAVASRDAEALAELYDRHAARLLGLIVRVVRERSDAEDVLQQVFWYVWNQAARYDARLASPVVWLVMLSRSRALDHVRRSRREQAARAGAASVGAADGTTKNAGTEACAGESGAADCGAATRRALDQLPAEQREVIALAFFRGLTHPQIATNLDLPLGTVKTRIRLGMSKLRDFVEQQRKVTPA